MPKAELSPAPASEINVVTAADIPPPSGRTAPAIVDVGFEVVEGVSSIDPDTGVEAETWGFKIAGTNAGVVSGTPGPVIRARVGDVLRLTLTGIARSTLYRHWSEPQDLHVEALDIIARAPDVTSPDTGNLRDDLRVLATRLGHALTETAWGRVSLQLFAGASINAEVAMVQKRFIESRLAVVEHILETARRRGEIGPDVKATDVTSTLIGPIYYRHHVLRIPLDPGWVERHVDRLTTLLTDEGGGEQSR